MQLSLPELAALVGGQFAEEADPPLLLRGFAGILEAEEGDLTFYAHPRYLSRLKKCRASAALVPLDFQEEVKLVCIRVADPMAAFATLVERYASKPVPYEPGIHPTAVIGAGVTLGADVSIQPYAVIEAGATIGARTVIGTHGFVGRNASVGSDCQLHTRVVLGERCLVGDRVIIHAGTVIGSDGFGFELENGRHVKIPQIGIVQIDSDVELGANVTVDRARFGRTWIQEGTKVDNLVHIAHNAIIGKHCLLVAQVGISGSTRLGQYVTLAGQVGVVGHVELADGVVVGAQGGVSKNLPTSGLYLGSPALPAHEYRDNMAHVRRLELLVEKVKRLEQELDSKSKSSPLPT